MLNLIISGSIFLAKAVAPNEVIHVNPRDTHLVFKVQAYSNKTHSLPNTFTEVIIYTYILGTEYTRKKCTCYQKQVGKIRNEFEI